MKQTTTVGISDHPPYQIQSEDRACLLDDLLVTPLQIRGRSASYGLWTGSYHVRIPRPRPHLQVTLQRRPPSSEVPSSPHGLDQRRRVLPPLTPQQLQLLPGAFAAKIKTNESPIIITVMRASGQFRNKNKKKVGTPTRGRCAACPAPSCWRRWKSCHRPTLWQNTPV